MGTGAVSKGAFSRDAEETWGVTGGESGCKVDGYFKSSRVTPFANAQPENIPILQTLSMLIRLT